MNRIAIAAMAAIFAASAGISQASTVGALPSPGWLNGSGNPNGNFTIVNNNGIELGQRAKLRQSPNTITPVDVGGVSTYSVPAGAQIGQPTRAAWNYEFSINVGPNNTLYNYFAMMTIVDPNGNTDTVDALRHWPDDSAYGLGGAITAPNTGWPDDSWQSTNYIAQNSENPAFGDFPLASFYNMSTPGTYTFTLNVYENILGDYSGQPLASNQIAVNVGAAAVPLPSAAWAGLGMMGALALGGVLRKKLV